MGGFVRRARRCDRIGTSQAHRPVDFGPRAEAGDWAGRYVNGDWFVALEDRDGLPVSPDAGAGEPCAVHRFSEDVYFASAGGEEGRPVGFPFRLVVGDDGRRYLMRGDRAYLHEADRPDR